MDLHLQTSILLLLVVLGSASLVQSSQCGSSGPPIQHRSYFYNYFDEVAVSTCTALSASHGLAGHVTAVRRTCTSGNSPSCAHVCQTTNSFSGYVSSWTCFDALHVYKNHPELADNYVDYVDSNKVGPVVYRYNSCAGENYCGPNYC